MKKTKTETSLSLFDQDKAKIIQNIHADNGMISLTDLWKEAGSIDSKAPKHWLLQDQTNGFLKALAKFQKVSQDYLIKVKRGKGGGTYAHKQIAMEYAQYLDPKLAVLVNEIFFERVEEEKNPDLIVDRAIKSYQRHGKDQKWISTRMESKVKRNFFTQCLAQHGVNKDGFRNCTNAVYNGLFGGTTAVVREKKGLQPKDNIRDNLSITELAAISLSEALAMEDIENNNRRGSAQCELSTSNATRSVAKAIIENRRANNNR